MISAHDITMRAFGVPFFYLPAVSGSMTERGSALRGLQFGNSQNFGWYAKTEWGLLEALGRHLPTYPREHRKHPFVFGGTLEAAGRHLWGILAAVFQQFRDDYLSDPDTPLDAPSVIAWFDELAARPSRDYADIESLQECMSLAVWNRWLRRLKSSDGAVAPGAAPNLPHWLTDLPADAR